MPLIEKQFIKNDKATPSDGLAIAAAIRFHGEEEKVIPRPRLLATLRLYLDRPSWAEQVLPEVARWEDWSALPRLVSLFQAADKELDSEVAIFALRVSIVRYLRVCPLPEAKQRLAELEKSHADVVRAADIYPFLPPGPSGSTSGRAKNDDGNTAKEKVKDKVEEPGEGEGDALEPSGKAKSRKAAKRKDSTGAAAPEREYPAVRTGLTVFAATAALLGLVVLILFGFRPE